MTLTVVPISEQKEYLRLNFTKVKLEDNKKRLLEPFWPYVYTLNIDDGIEANSCYQQVIYANRPVETGIFDETLCVIKLHGDVAEKHLTGMRTFSWTINPSLSPFIMLL